ncbi:MAG: type I-C CRISPR-associated protein Cas8c/Csd1 [Actinomycetota bacterium]|nr:type I-C CRISPR-associated protein Cas8c/Csd1 [Actinomycetota bacterium]
MFLQRLEADADRIVDMPPPMYDKKPVKWVVDLTADGGFLGIVSTAAEGEARDRGKQHLVPFVKRAFGIRPILLADTPAYTFGIDPADTRAAEKHEAYVGLLRQCVEATESAAVRAVLMFLQGNLDRGLPADAGRSDLVTFRVGGEFVVDTPGVRDFWRGTVEPASKLRETTIGQCLVCGERKPIPLTTPVPVKGIPGGNRLGPRW